jgi:hypothetical protein
MTFAAPPGASGHDDRNEWSRSPKYALTTFTNGAASSAPLRDMAIICREDAATRRRSAQMERSDQAFASPAFLRFTWTGELA